MCSVFLFSHPIAGVSILLAGEQGVRERTVKQHDGVMQMWAIVAKGNVTI